MKSTVVCFWLILGLSAWCFAQTAPVVPPEVPTPVPCDEQHPLPAYMTEAERLLPLPPVQATLAPPSGAVRTPADYEPAEGLFIAWEGYTSILTQIAVYATTGGAQPAHVWVVVDNTSEQTTAANALSAAGANMSFVHFIVRTTDTVWIRDYGPRFIFEDGNRAIIDHTYNRPRPNDDAFNDYLASLWGIAQYDLPLTHGGGNFHLFSNGDAFMTSLILNENPGWTEQQVKDAFEAYENVNLTIYPAFPSSFDSTQHIDMWFFPVGDSKVIIGQYSPSTGQPYTITENAVADLVARGYTVYRTPGWNSGGTHYTYTNAVILNDQVLISRFNVAQDAQALATFQAALPGYTIRQIDNSDIIGAAGAMHCIVMHVPAYPSGPTPTVTVAAPNGGETWFGGQTYDIRWTARDDVAVTAIDIYLSTDGGVTFPRVIATGETNDGTFSWTVPHVSSTQCRVKVIAWDGDGNFGEDVSNANFTITRTGPQLVYNFPLDTNPGWSTQGQWQFGQPTGQGGTYYGYPDPTGGATGTNVYGVNLSGDYSTTPGGPYYLTAGPFNLTGHTAARLRFQRWLNTDYSPYARATVQVSNNGTTWTQVWANGSSTIAESQWSTQEYDISAVADDRPIVYIRWGYQISSGAWPYSGWNIDDIQLWAVPPPAGCPGDMNCDDSITYADIDWFVEALAGESAWTHPECPWINADCSGDGQVTYADIDPFVSLIGTTCP